MDRRTDRQAEIVTSRAKNNKTKTPLQQLKLEEQLHECGLKDYNYNSSNLLNLNKKH